LVVQPAASLNRFCRWSEHESIRGVRCGQFQIFGAIEEKIATDFQRLERIKKILKCRCLSRTLMQLFPVEWSCKKNPLHLAAAISTEEAQEMQKSAS
jgi:hypothetical protein